MLQVGLIIGKGGETIKGLQTRSGARIQVDMLLVMLACQCLHCPYIEWSKLMKTLFFFLQLIPQHPPEGVTLTERTVRVTGNKKQIEVAKDLIKQAMNQVM